MNDLAPAPTTGDLLLKAILTDPADDLARLVYADWLEENGEPERAEFVRVQVELARSDRTVNEDEPLCAREHELWARYARDWAGVLEKYECSVWQDRVVWYRGFVSELTLTAADWLAHADAIYWHPEQTVKCPDCAGWLDDQMCSTCVERGRIPRPFVATAHPIQRVRLTAGLSSVERQYNPAHRQTRCWLPGRAAVVTIPDRVIRARGEHLSWLPGLLERTTLELFQAEWPHIEFTLP